MEGGYEEEGQREKNSIRKKNSIGCTGVTLAHDEENRFRKVNEEAVK